jgi:hypothetical protein
MDMNLCQRIKAKDLSFYTMNLFVDEMPSPVDNSQDITIGCHPGHLSVWDRKQDN